MLYRHECVHVWVYWEFLLLCFDTWLWKMDLKWSSAAYFMKKRKKILSHRIHTQKNECFEVKWLCQRNLDLYRYKCMACQNTTTTAHSPVVRNCKGPVMHGLGRRDWEAYFINCVCAELNYLRYSSIFSANLGLALRRMVSHLEYSEATSTFKKQLVLHWSLIISFYLHTVVIPPYFLL